MEIKSKLQLFESNLAIADPAIKSAADGSDGPRFKRMQA